MSLKIKIKLELLSRSTFQVKLHVKIKAPQSLHKVLVLGSTASGASSSSQELLPWSHWVNVFKFFYSHWPALNHNNTANCFWSKLVEMEKCFDQKDLSSHTFKTKESSVHAVTSLDILQLSPSINDMRNHSRNSFEGTDDVVIHDGNISLSSWHGGKSIQDVPNSS